jgi:hypothetical protein
VSEQEYEAIRSSLSGIAGGTITGGFTTGSFAYSPDALRDLANEWTDLARDYQKSLTSALHMTQVEGPGTEFVSQSYASAANASGQAYVDSLKNRIDYCYEQARKCQDTLDDYLGVEHRNVRGITNAGPQEGI